MTFKEQLVSILKQETAVLNPEDAEGLADVIMDSCSVRVILGLHGGISCGYSSDAIVKLDIIDHDIREDIDPDPTEEALYEFNLEELDALPYNENGLKEGRII